MTTDKSDVIMTVMHRSFPLAALR